MEPYFMTNFMTEETPGKVFSLLGVALTSMFFMFAVTQTTASFQKVEVPMPDPFAPQNVVAMLDNASYSYAEFLHQNLFVPAEAQYAFIADNVGFVADNAGPALASLAGLNGPVPSSLAAAQPQVAGASTQIIVSDYYPASSGGSIFSWLLGN